MLYTVILAGGQGKRFSYNSVLPKQFVALQNSTTMIEKTYELAKKISPKEKIFVVGLDEYKDKIKELIDIEDKNIILEPDCRDTYAAIMYATIMIKKIQPNAVLLFLPTDLLLEDELDVLKATSIGYNFILGNLDKILLFGSRYGKLSSLHLDVKVGDVKERPIYITSINEKEGEIKDTGIYMAYIDTFLEHFNHKELHEMKKSVEGGKLGEYYKHIRPISMTDRLIESDGRLVTMLIDTKIVDADTHDDILNIISIRDEMTI